MLTGIIAVIRVLEGLTVAFVVNGRVESSNGRTDKVPVSCSGLKVAFNRGCGVVAYNDSLLTTVISMVRSLTFQSW